MNIFLILFFIALFGITIMIVRKYFTIKHLEIKNNPDLDLEFEVPELEELQKFFSKRIKRYGYVILVLIIKLYILSSNFVKEKSISLYKKIKKRIFKHKTKTETNKETSPFIKTIKDYKKKIKRITNKIKEEEGLN